MTFIIFSVNISKCMNGLKNRINGKITLAKFSCLNQGEHLTFAPIKAQLCTEVIPVGNLE